MERQPNVNIDQTFKDQSGNLNVIDQKIHSSKHHIQKLKKSLQNAQRINNLLLEKLSSLKQRNPDTNPVAWLNEVFATLETLRGNEAQLRKTLSDKEKKIKDLKLQKVFLSEKLKCNVSLYPPSNPLSRQLIKRSTYTSIKEKDMLEKIAKENQTYQMPDNIEISIKNKNEPNPLVIEQLTNLGLLEMRIVRLNNYRTEQNLMVHRLQLDFKAVLDKWVDFGGTMPIHNVTDLNNVKRGSWINLVWKWLMNDYQTEENEKTTELMKIISDLQANLSSYEDLLHNMNLNFERFNQNEEVYTKEIAELKERLSGLLVNEKRNLEITDKLNSELLLVNEQNIQFKDKINELELQADQYRLELEQLRRKGTKKFQQANSDQKKNNLELGKRANQIPNGTIPGLTRELKQNVRSPLGQSSQMNNLKRQTAPANSNASRKLDLMKKFYPHASNQASIFNPFKY
jgi:chromosome segregation ATPase